VFSTFLKESRLPVQSKSVSWEAIRELLEKYNVSLRLMFEPLSSQRNAIVYSILKQGNATLKSHKYLADERQDPIMAQFPIALAIEPRLLSYAVANGFYMDTKV
jgi:hypothetical protein